MADLRAYAVVWCEALWKKQSAERENLHEPRN
jgi:hypothetical protein